MVAPRQDGLTHRWRAPALHPRNGRGNPPTGGIRPPTAGAGTSPSPAEFGVNVQKRAPQTPKWTLTPNRRRGKAAATAKRPPAGVGRGNPRPRGKRPPTAGAGPGKPPRRGITPPTPRQAMG